MKIYFRQISEVCLLFTTYLLFLCPQDIPGKNTGVVCHFLLQCIFPIQGLNPGLLHCRQILYQLRYQGSPTFLLLWQPTLVLLARKSSGWRSLAQAIVHGVKKSRTWLSDFTFIFIIINNVFNIMLKTFILVWLILNFYLWNYIIKVKGFTLFDLMYHDPHIDLL